MEYPLGPLSIPMVEQVFRWEGIDPGDFAPAIAEKILGFVRDGALDRDFRRWCASGEAPACAAQLGRKWIELLFNSVAGHIYAHGYYLDWASVSEALPFGQYFCESIYCAEHAKLDGFVARFDDPVWKDVYPLNGWMCGCAVAPIMEEDLEVRPYVARSVAEGLRLRCGTWLQSRPDKILRLL